MTLPNRIKINDIEYVRADTVSTTSAVGSVATTSTTLPFETYPENLPVMTYLDAVKAVAALGDGWRIPTREELLLMYERRDAIGGFITKSSGSDFPGWYWSSTEDRDNPSYVWDVRFSDGNEDWNLKDNIRLSCRPVRLVPAAG